MCDLVGVDEDEEGALVVSRSGAAPRVLPASRATTAIDSDSARALDRLLEDPAAPAPADRVSGTRAAQLAGSSLAGALGAGDPGRSGAAPAAPVIVGMRSAELRRLPWELLSDPVSGQALACGRGVVRVSATRAGDPQQRVRAAPLRVLFVVARPSGARDVPQRVLAGPLAGYFAETGTIFHLLRPPTLAGLREALEHAHAAGRPYTVVHIDAHGGVDDDGAFVLLENGHAGRARVSADALADTLSGLGVVVVAINACRSGADGRGAGAGLGQRLSACDVSAVVAMGFVVAVDTVRTFFLAFYRGLAHGDPVTAVVAAARAELRERGAYVDSAIGVLDWAVPVHHASADPAFVPAPWPPRPGSGDDAGGRLVGRDDAVRAVEQAALRSRVVLVHGPVGIGKTALAEDLARWWCGTGASTGATFTDLRDGPSALPSPTDESALVVWDGFEAVHDPGLGWYRRHVLAALRHPHGVVLLLSRGREDWLGPVAARVSLGELDGPSSSELAALRCGRPLSAAGDVGALVRWLGGHPQALCELLPAVFGSDARHVLATLRQGGWQQAGAPYISLAGPLDEAVGRLPNAVRASLVVLCVFGRVIDLDVLVRVSQRKHAPARIAGMKRSEWLEVLAAATQAGLLAPGESTTYTMHPALPAVLADRWRGADPKQVDRDRDAIATAVYEHSGQANPALLTRAEGPAVIDDPDLLHEAETKIRRLRGLFLWGEAESALWPLRWQFTAEQRQNVLADMDKSESAGIGPLTLAWVRFVDDDWPQNDRDVHAAVRGCHAVLRRLQRGQVTLLDRQRMVDVHRQLAAMTARQGRYDPAETSCREALAIVDDPEVWSVTPAAQAHAAGDLVDTATVRAEHRAALELRLTTVLGLLLRFDEADEHGQRALRSNRAIRHHRGEALALDELSGIALAVGRLDDARRHAVDALTAYQRLGDRAGTSWCYHQLGQVAFSADRPADAREWYLRASHLAGELRAEHLTATVESALGELAAHAGRFREAIRRHSRARTLYAESGNVGAAAMQASYLGAIVFGAGDPAQAQNWLHEALRGFERAGDDLGASAAAAGLSLIAAHRGDPRAARRWQARADRLGRAVGDPGLGLSGPRERLAEHVAARMQDDRRRTRAARYDGEES